MLEAILEGVILREEALGGASTRTQAFFEFYEPEKKELHDIWEKSADREKRSRTMFAQETIRFEEVAKEVEAVRSAIGSGSSVEGFTKEALKLYGATISDNGATVFDVREVPRGLRDVLGTSENSRPGSIFLSRRVCCT